jgi:hypothetical protein
VSLPSDARRIAALKVLIDDISQTLTEAKAALLEVMAEHAITGVAARLPDGTKAAHLPYAGGETRAQVTDEAALVAWMELNRPGELVKTVRPDTVKAILAAANAQGQAVDKASGEAIPGIGFAPTTPYTQVNFTHGKEPGEDGRELIRRAWRTGELQITELLALSEEGDA